MVTLSDGQGGTVIKQVDVVITGTNDAPVLATTTVTGAVTEQGTPAGNLTSSGSIGFTDVDLTDVHTVSAAAIGSQLGTLTASKVADTTDAGTGGSILWNYSVADSAVEYLAAGQTKIESFTVTLNDGHGGTVARQVDVTITGTNDAPVVTAANTAGTVTEAANNSADETNNALHQATGNIGFTDVDLTDSHAVSVTPGNSGYLGTLSYSLSDFDRQRRRRSRLDFRRP